MKIRPKTKKYQALADCSCGDDGSLKSDHLNPQLNGNWSNELLIDVVVESLATNGPVPTAPTRASPAPQGQQLQQPMPNGKPTSPYNERSNPTSPNAQIAAQTVSSKDPKAAAQAASDMRNVVRRKLTGYVGFANLPNQWHRKSVRKGFNFNVMIVGMLINCKNLAYSYLLI